MGWGWLESDCIRVPTFSGLTDVDPRHLFMDERLRGICGYCGGTAETRDHVPSKVLLDEPFLSDLPVVGACTGCNSSLSLDEQYLACFLECVLSGTSEPARLHREKVKRILVGNASLRARISASCRCDESAQLVWEPEIDRVRRVMLKLARGHVAYELYPYLEEPREINIIPLSSMSESERTAFEDLSSADTGLLPELGSRAFFRKFSSKPDNLKNVNGWIVVQRGRYRYAVSEAAGPLVRIVLSEYLACWVAWE
jgi:hypothetical protein